MKNVEKVKKIVAWIEMGRVCSEGRGGGEKQREEMRRKRVGETCWGEIRKKKVGEGKIEGRNGGREVERKCSLGIWK